VVFTEHNCHQRTAFDARENLITSLEIAAAKKDGRAIVPEVCLYFDYALLRGCQCQKVETCTSMRFESENYPPLAKAASRSIMISDDSNFEAGALKLLSKFDSAISS